MRLADSNILLYAVSADPAEASKRARAIEVLGEDSLALSVQVPAGVLLPGHPAVPAQQAEPR